MVLTYEQGQFKKRKRDWERDWGGRGRGREGGRQGRKVPGYWKPDLAMTHLLIWFVRNFLLYFIFPSLLWTHSSIQSYGPGTEPGPEEAACVLFQVCSSLWWSFSFSLSLFEPAPPALEALGLNHWTTREVPPPQLFPAHIQADFPQWPCDLNSGLSPFLESVSNASATPDNPKTIPSVFLFQGLCSLESGFLPETPPSHSLFTVKEARGC